MKMYDVAVIGCGPAGATAARDLARRGMSVALVDKERLPRYKVCGGGIVYRARAMLGVDIAPVLEGECYSASVSLLNSGVSFTASRDVPIVSMVMRSKFDLLLAELAEQAGAELMPGFCIQDADFEDDHVVLRGDAGHLGARFVIAADGANGAMARLAGWKESRRLAPALECELAVSDATMRRFEGCARFDFDMPPNGYGWVFPKGNHLSVGVGGFGSGRKFSLKEMFFAYMRKLDIDVQDDVDVHGYVVPISPRTDGFVRKRVLLVGDAAGMADPVSAEGISFAIRSARIAAGALVDAQLKNNEAEMLFESRLDDEVLVELAAGRKLAKLLYASEQARLWVMRNHGERMAEAIAEIYLGNRTYLSAADAFLERIKSKLLFS
jgi:geranylgeranyl reductase family protein